MVYKNSFKIFFSNTSMIWKLLVFFVLVTAFSTVVSSFACMPIINVLRSEGLFVNITDTYAKFVTDLNLNELFISISDIGDKFIFIINSNLSNLIIHILFFFFSVLILSNFLRSFYLMATCTSLNYFMSSGLRQGFCKSLVEDFNKNVKYQLLYLFTILPIKLGIYYLVFLSFKLLKFGGIISIIAPFISIAIYTVLNAIRMTIFSCWVPLIVVRGEGVFKSLIHSFSYMLKRFWRTLASAFCVVLTIMFLNVFVGIFTFGVAFIITIPSSFFLTAIFNMITFYNSSGKRFYVDMVNVIAPKRLELTDKLLKIKYIV